MRQQPRTLKQRWKQATTASDQAVFDQRQSRYRGPNDIKVYNSPLMAITDAIRTPVVLDKSMYAKSLTM